MKKKSWSISRDLKDYEELRTAMEVLHEPKVLQAHPPALPNMSKVKTIRRRQGRKAAKGTRSTGKM